MEKQALKTVIEQLKKGEEIKIAFIGGRGGFSLQKTIKVGMPLQGFIVDGLYQVFSVKRGRGKHGSLILTLASPTNPEEPLCQVGTPTNEEVLSIECKGILHGASSEEDIEKRYPKDIDAAMTLKKKLSPLLHLKEGVKLKLQVSSTEPKYNGVFDLVSAKAMTGRWGQIKLDLSNIETNEVVELWSYRHATIIQDIKNVTLLLIKN